MTNILPPPDINRPIASPLGSSTRQCSRVNAVTTPQFNTHLQHSNKENIIPYSPNERYQSKAQDTIVRRFEGINGRMLNQQNLNYIFVLI
eukprot:snap_masked-scaffold_133-processed-gene-0.2-mRNA-1 protein AED:1.00 eAED:1.00 QI:0/0/0/0/1/1/2/0/89